MSLEQIAQILRRKIFLILSIIILSTGISGYISWCLLDNIYEASATVLVSKIQDSSQIEILTYNDYQLNIKLVNSYRILCRTDRVLNQVIDQLQLPIKASDLREKVSVSSEDDTEIIRISVTDNSPKTAMDIANKLVMVFQAEVADIMKMDNVQVIDFAKLPYEPIRPDRIENLYLATLTGLVAGIALAIISDYFNKTVRSEEQIAEIAGITLVGILPRIKTKGQAT